MADDGRTYIRVHDGMPDHPKVDALSDRAFRVLVETWCWCSRHLTDGRVPRNAWDRRATPKVRRELVAAGLVEDLGPDGVAMHDYLVHQRSRAEVEVKTTERRDAARRASVKANHTRWHIPPKGHPSPDCELCARASDSDPDRTSDRSSAGRSERSPSGSHIGIGIGRGEVVTLGGEDPDSNAREDQHTPAPIFDPDEPRCARHAGIPAGQHVPACRDCAEIRRIALRLVVDTETDLDLARKTWRAEVDACDDCDENGRVELPSGALARHHPHPDDDQRSVS